MRSLFNLLTIALIPVISYAQKNPYAVSTNNIKSADTIKASEFVQQFSKISMIDWKPGMKFMTEPVKIKALGNATRIELAPNGSTNFVNDQIKQGDFEWKTFTYLSLEQRIVKCLTGLCKYTYLIFECENKKYQYEFMGDTAALRKATDTYIKKIVYLDEVDKVKPLLTGKILYMLTSTWLVDDEKGRTVKSENNQRFIPVTVISVGLGTPEGPSKVVFKQESTGKEGFLNIRLSGINKSPGLYGINFDDAFTIEDPTKTYKDIKPEIWTVIKDESMRIGMTKKEARLSWGKPKDVRINGSEEEWVYETSGTLHFKNGLVARIVE